MNESDAARQQATAGQLPADADQRGNPSLDLMPIRKPLDTDMGEGHRKLFSLTQVQGNAFIDDRAVALRPAKSVAQQLGGIQHIIERPDLAKIIVARNMKSEKIILQCVRDQLDKSDLTLHGEPNAIVFDLLTRHTGLH